VQLLTGSWPTSPSRKPANKLRSSPGSTTHRRGVLPALIASRPAPPKRTAPGTNGLLREIAARYLLPDKVTAMLLSGFLVGADPVGAASGSIVGVADRTRRPFRAAIDAEAASWTIDSRGRRFSPMRGDAVRQAFTPASGWAWTTSVSMIFGTPARRWPLRQGQHRRI